jgi:phasin family protein
MPARDAETMTTGAHTGPETLTHTTESTMKTTEDFLAFGQGNVEAFVKAGQIWAAGAQDLSRQFAAAAQTRIDETMGMFKALSGVKSIKDAFDLQAGFARAAFEAGVADSGKFTDASLKLAEQALEPITARMTQTIDSVTKAV